MAEPPNKIDLPSRPTTSSFLYPNSAALTPTPSPGRADGSYTLDEPTGQVPHPSQAQGRQSLRSLGIGHAATQRGPQVTPANTNRKQSVSSTRLRNRASKASFSSPGVGTGTRRGSRSTMGRNRDISGLLSPGGLDDGGLPKIPTLVPGIRPAYSTPLPVLPMVVLCIAMLSEFLSANVSTPFLLQMVEDFFKASGSPSNSETDAAVGLWTGNLVSVFFITQFVTSLLWSGIADRHGRRAVLVASLLGSALCVVIFGTSGSLREAICIRLAQGIFGGAIGVFRGSIRDITDETNATRAYAVLGFSWGMGGVLGPIIGGVFESPAVNHPDSFLGKIALFERNPYLLPTLIAASILTTGAVLACFLSWDGGVRGGGRITLPIAENEPLQAETEATDAFDSPAPSALHGKQTSYFTGRINDNEALSPAVAGTGAARRGSMASMGGGTAYGYGGVRSKHPTLAAQAARRVSTATARLPAQTGDEDQEEHEESTAARLAQRFLLAAEENTFSINDLWVSAAIAQDASVFDDDDDDEEGYSDEEESENAFEDSPAPSPATAPSTARSAPRHELSPLLHERFRSGRGRLNSNGEAYGTSSALPNRIVSGQAHRFSTSAARRFSTSSGAMPAIFAHTGLATPPAIAAAYDQDPFGSAGGAWSPAAATAGNADPFVAPVAGGGGLSVITERSSSIQVAGEEEVVGTKEVVQEKAVSGWRALPIAIIVQYGVFALHTTTHDQLFLSFLVTPYKSGGLGLNPAHFSFLIAEMCAFQLYFQFNLYPRLGPPLGKFSHVAMFRLGSALYIPAYLALPLLRSIASPDKEGGFVVMTLLTLVMAIRYCGSTFAYTSIMVLINAMSPPPVVGIANGLAQSTVSFSRFFGPVVGGILWSTSINGNPGGYATGFYVVAGFCFLQVSSSYLIR